MKKYRRLLFVIVISLFVALALYGCGSSSNDDDQSNETPDQQEQDDNNTDNVDLGTAFKDVDFPDNISYEMVYSSQGAESYTTRLWMMDDKLRMESEMGGQVYITIQDGENLYTLDPTTMIAMKFSMDDGEDEEDDPMDDQVQLDNFTPDDDWGELAYVKEETLNGVKTYVVTDTLSADGTEYKMWIHQEYGIAVRIESSGPNAEDDFVLEVNNLEVGKVTDADFEIPEEYEVMDFGS
jgi:outer membrane lipoprotein-sorting protein